MKFIVRFFCLELNRLSKGAYNFKTLNENGQVRVISFF